MCSVAFGVPLPSAICIQTGVTWDVGAEAARWLAQKSLRIIATVIFLGFGVAGLASWLGTLLIESYFQHPRGKISPKCSPRYQ